MLRTTRYAIAQLVSDTTVACMSFDPAATFNSILDALASGSHRVQLLHSRPTKHADRRVYLFDSRMAVKVFLLRGVWRGFRRPWRAEHRALKRLDGWRAPRAMGWRRARVEGHSAILLVREYIAGETPQAAEPDLHPELAELLAGYHARGVVTNDPHLYNVIRDASGRLSFIDFGRARTFRRGNPVCWFYIGKELFRVYDLACEHDPDRFNKFMNDYWRAAGRPTGLERVTIGASFRYWCRRRGLKPVECFQAHA